MLLDSAKGRWSRTLALGVLCVRGGCASRQDFVGIPRTGYQSNGTYVVSPEAVALACRQIEDRIAVLDQQMAAFPVQAAVERESRPTTVGSALGRMFGGSDESLKATKDFQRARAESDALKELMVRKQCT